MACLYGPCPEGTSRVAVERPAPDIPVTSTTGFANGYNIGITLSDGTIQWTTESGSPSGSTITLAASLTGNVSNGAYVYVYQTANRISTPKRILHANRLRPSDGSSAPLVAVSREQDC